MTDQITQLKSYVRTFMLIQSGDHISGASSATGIVVQISKNGGAFTSPPAVASAMGFGWYSLALTTTDTNTQGDLTWHVAATGADPQDWSDQIVAPSVTAGSVIGSPTVNVAFVNGAAALTPGAAGGMLIAGTNAHTIFNDGLTISSTSDSLVLVAGGNGSGINATGAGSGAGMKLIGGSSGAGFSAAGNGTGAGINAQSGSGASAHGIIAQSNAASGSGNGITGQGAVGGDGMALTGGATGRGLHAIGGSTSGSGARFEGNPSAAAAYGFHALGIGSNDAARFEGSTGLGFNVLGGASGIKTTSNSVLDKTGYSLTQSFPSNFASMAITAGGVVSASISGTVTAGTVIDKTGYSLAGTVTTGTILDKTGFSLSNSGIDALYTRQLTESYAALHTVPTISQLLFEMRAHHAEKSISQTTVTVLQIDGSTAAAVYSLNNTSPTSITRNA